MTSPSSVNPQMVVDVNYKLRDWWNNIKKDHEIEIRHLLLGLTFLIFVILESQLIRALLQFCDPSRMVFKLSNFELIPKIEEISGFIKLSYHECKMIIPYKPSLKDFLEWSKIQHYLDLGWISLNFLNTRFNHEESFIISMRNLSTPSRDVKNIV